MHPIPLWSSARPSDSAATEVCGRAGRSQPDGGRREGADGPVGWRHEKGEDMINAAK